MGRVSLDINGRKYAMGCEDGEEERLFRLFKTIGHGWHYLNG